MVIWIIFMKFLCGIYFVLGDYQHDDACPETCYEYQDPKQIVRWPRTPALQEAPSTPICLAENWEIQYRHCIARNDSCFNSVKASSQCEEIPPDDPHSTSCWEPPPICDKVQGEISNPCPEDLEFNEKYYLCIMVLTNMTFPPNCPYKEVVEFARYSSLKSNLSPDPIWLPVQRDIGDYGTGLMYWVEPYEKYHEEYNSNPTGQWPGYNFVGEISNKNCLVYHNNSFVELVSCQDNHTAICAYEILYIRERTLCTQAYKNNKVCKQSEYPSDSPCFCRDDLNQFRKAGLDLAEFIQPYQNLLYESLTTETCYIGLARENETFFWTSSQKEITYTNWANTTFDFSKTIGAFSKNGWILVDEEELQCSIVKKPSPDSTEAEMTIQSFPDSTFHAILASPSSWLWNNDSHPYVFCFTDSHKYDLIYRIQPTYINGDEIGQSIKFQFNSIDNTPGNYWCEAHVYPNIEKYKSNKTLFRPNDYYQGEYVTVLKYMYDEEDPLSSDYLKNIVDNLDKEICPYSKFTARISKVLEVNEKEKNLTISFHLSYRHSLNNTDEFGELEDTLKNNLKTFKFIVLLSTDYCIKNMTRSRNIFMHWPDTPINGETYPLGGYCVKRNGTFVKRYCRGNFTDGASWSIVDDDCIYYETTTNVTDALIAILEEDNLIHFVDNVEDMSASTPNLTALDIYLFSKYLSQIKCENESVLHSIVKIISNLMDINRSTLKRSQQDLNATDLILHHVDNIFKQCNFESKIVEKNFAVVTSDIEISSISGVIVRKSQLNYVVETITIDTYLALSNLVAAVQISNDLFQQILSSAPNPQFIVSVHFSNVLFNDPKTSKTTSTIFGVLLPNFNEQFKGPLNIIFSEIRKNVSNFNCSYWEYDADNIDNLSRGFWENDDQHDNDHQYFICHFYHLTHFAAISQNITHELESILRSPSINDTIEKLVTTSESSELFQTIDLLLLSKIFRRISLGNVDADGNRLSRIMSNLFQISKQVLREAEIKSSALEDILKSYNDIIMRLNNTSIFEQVNMVTILSIMPDSDIKGIIVANCRKYCQVKTFNTIINLDSVNLNFDVALLFNEGLLEEMSSKIGKVLINVFFNDYLLIDMVNEKTIFSPISVHFPKEIGAQNNSIDLFYNVELINKANVSYACAYIFVRKWRHTEDIINFKDFIHCQFFIEGYFSLVDLNSVSNLTSKLSLFRSILNANNLEKVLSEVEALCRLFWRIDATAIGVISDIFSFLSSKIERVNVTVLELVLNIVDDLINVPRSILISSRWLSNATNKILEEFAEIIEKCDSDLVLRKNNIALIITRLSEKIKGVAITSECNIVLVEDWSTLNKVNIKYAILPSDAFVQTILADSNAAKMVTAIFFSDQLFLSNISSAIILVKFPNCPHILPDTVSTLFYYNSEDISDYRKCSFWVDGENESWQLYCGYEQRTYKSCTSKINGYSTVVRSPSKNITEVLEGILETENNSNEILCKTDEISSFYGEFKEVDIDLVVKILNIVTLKNAVDINHFVGLIDNILEINETTLQSSYTMYNSTANILDQIITKFANYVDNSPPYIQYKQNNFAVSTWKPKKEDIYGCMVDVDSSLSFILNDSLTYKEIDCALIFSEDLLTQLRGNTNNYSNVVVVIYFNDKLFSQSERKINNKIFGLSIPDGEEMLIRNFSILYNISSYNTTLDNVVADLSVCAEWNKEPDPPYWFWNPTYEDDTYQNIMKKCDFRGGQYFTLIGKSSVTQALEEIKNDGNNMEEKLENVQNVMDSYDLFIPADIYLISEILLEATVVSADIIKVETVGKLVASLMSVSKQVLYESQIKYGATDNILVSIQTLSSKSKYDMSEKCLMNTVDYGNMIISTTKFSDSTNILRGFTLKNCRTNCNVSVLIGPSSSNDGDDDDDINIIFSEEFSEYLEGSDQNIVLTVFKNDVLFNDPAPDVKGHANIVIGILVPNVNVAFDYPISIYFKKGFFSPRVQLLKCVAWHLPVDQETVGHWTSHLGSTDTDSSVVHCRFRKLSYNFALIESELNVTFSLECIVSSPEAFSYRISSLSRLLVGHYSDFTCYDLNLTVRILSDSSNQITSHDVNCLVSIVDSIMKMQRNALIACNKDYNITDGVLNSIDDILKNYSDSESLKLPSDNFAVVISYMDYETNFKGILVHNCSQTHCNITAKNSTHYPEFTPKVDIDLEFSDTLLPQLRNSCEKVILTIFFTDILFTTEESQKVSKVVGVLLPESVKVLEGPIQIIYDLSGVNAMCAFWSYETKGPSFWKNDGQPSGDATCQFFHTTHFALVDTSSIQTITDDLTNIWENDGIDPEQKLVLVKNITSYQYTDLEDIDIFLISQIMLQAVQQNVDNINITSSIIGDLFLVDSAILMDSQKNYNATDTILHCLDEISKNSHEEAKFVYDYFVVIVTLVNNSNIKGLILEKCSDVRCDLSIEKDINVSQISKNDDINAAIVLSDELKKQIFETTTSRVIITIHFKNIFFNEKNNHSRGTSKVFGVILPDLNETLKGNIAIIFNTGQSKADVCAYWDFKMNDNGDALREGRWTKDNPRNQIELMSLCEFSHLTHFALLLLSNDEGLEPYYQSLDLITHIGCTLSIIGVLGIIGTALLFKKWRRNTGNQILLNFALAILLQIIMMYASAIIFDNGSSSIVCTVTGAVLHYSLLSEFCWMLIIAILQFKRFVEVLGGPPKYIFLKALVCGWLFPIFPVVLVLALDPLNYTEGKVGLCYPTELGLYLGVYLPVAMIVFINLVIFIFIMYNVFHKKTEYRDTANHEILFQWRLALLLFSMLGLTWLFGFLAQINQWFIFVYLFCISASLQGFVMFLFFIVFNKSTRFLYAQAIKFWLYNKGLKNKM